MSRCSIAAFSLGAALCSPALASAEVTAADVWENWQAMSAFSGQELSARSEVMMGDTLVLEGITGQSTLPEGEFSYSLDWVRMRETGDGAVEVTWAPEQVFSGRVTAEPGEEIAFDATLASSGMTWRVSGAPERLVQDIAIDELALTRLDIAVNGEPMPFEIDFAATGLAGSYVSEPREGDAIWTSGDLTGEGFSFAMTGTDPESGADIEAQGTGADLAATYGGTIMPLPADGNPFASGMDFEFDMTFGETRTVVAGVEDGAQMRMETTTEGGSFGFAMSPERLRYEGAGRGLAYSMEAEDLPFPISAAIGESAFRLVMPIARTEEPEDFELMVALRDAMLDETIWNLFDPSSTLERGPLNLVVDLAGKGRWLVDVLAGPEALESLEGEAGELDSLSLREFELSAAGARVTGTGDFTFDNEKTEMFEGFPQPEGAVDLRIAGAMTLIDKLTQMGLVPQEEAMTTRMMLAMFAVPVEGEEDTMTSRFEIGEDGVPVVNGVPLQ